MNVTSSSSMGYGQDETGVVRRRFGWLNHEGGQNRLNVAITRAKKEDLFCILLCTLNPLKSMI